MEPQKNGVLFGLAIVLVLGIGCAVGPDYERPETNLPDRWTDQRSETETAMEAELARWWTLFADPVLNSLVERAVESNLDLRMAELRVNQARAARGLTRSNLGPSLGASGSYRRSETENNASDHYQTGFDASWELDIFGGVRRSVEASEADLQASVEDRRDVLVTLTAEVARNYFELRAFQEQIAVTRKNIEAQEHTLLLTRQRYATGFASRLDVINAEAQAANTTSQIPSQGASIRQSIYSLSLMLGREPGALLEELSAPAEMPIAPPAVPLGVPSDLLLRRPDIRRAEARVHAATARIGVATADLFPRFTISGSIGFQAGNFDSLFNGSNRTASFGPSFSWNLFNSGRVRSNIEQQEILQEQSLLAYQQTVLTALHEVENILITSSKEEERRSSLSTAVSSNKRAVELAVALYTAGQVDYLEVLQAQRGLYSAESTLIQNQKEVALNLIALYKALGGGWKEGE